MQQPNKASTAEARKNSKKERKKKNIEPKRDRRTDQRAPIYLYLNQEERERERERERVERGEKFRDRERGGDWSAYDQRKVETEEMSSVWFGRRRLVLCFYYLLPLCFFEPLCFSFV
jgi:hypothetical protein